jgi:hypothetical protein
MTVMNMTRTLVRDHALCSWSARAYYQIVSAEIKRRRRHRIERHQVLIKTSGVRDAAEKRRLYISMAQLRGQGISVQNQCK